MGLLFTTQLVVPSAKGVYLLLLANHPEQLPRTWQPASEQQKSCCAVHWQYGIALSCIVWGSAFTSSPVGTAGRVTAAAVVTTRTAKTQMMYMARGGLVVYYGA